MQSTVVTIGNILKHNIVWGINKNDSKNYKTSRPYVYNLRIVLKFCKFRRSSYSFFILEVLEIVGKFWKSSESSVVVHFWKLWKRSVVIKILKVDLTLKKTTERPGTRRTSDNRT